MGLRIRKKKNKSGSISIVIVDRSNRGYKVIETIGYSKDKDEIEALYQKALLRINELEKNLFFISNEDNKKAQLKNFFLQITNENLIPIGDELIFGKLFEMIGCKKILKK